MKIELSPQLVAACLKYNALEDGEQSLAAINLAALIGEGVAARVAMQIDRHAELIKERDELTAAWRAGNADATTTGYALGALDEEIKAIEKALK